MEAAELIALRKRLVGKLAKATIHDDDEYFQVGIVTEVNPCCTYSNGDHDYARVGMDTRHGIRAVCDTDEYRFTVWGEEQETT